MIVLRSICEASVNSQKYTMYLQEDRILQISPGEFIGTRVDI